MTRAKGFLARGLVVACALGLWFWTQSLIGARGSTASTLTDSIHLWTQTWNAALWNRPGLADAVLMGSSLYIDAVGLFLLLGGLFGASFRPVLGLVALFFLRQMCQFVVALPAPEGMLWRNPGFPSLFVTYGVSNDLFFSGHTALAVYGFTEIRRLKKPVLTWLSAGAALAEVAVVLVLRAHYFIDVFTGALAALWVASWIHGAAAVLDRKLPGRRASPFQGGHT